MIKPEPNSNFSSLSEQSVHDRDDADYREYRRLWFAYPQQMIVSEFPLHLDIEATSRCNLKCTFCDKLPLIEKKEIGDIRTSLYKSIVDEGHDNGLRSIKLSYRGEPLLHPEIVEMVDYAKNKSILDIYFNTNGMLLSKRISKRLMDAGLDRISISIDGTDPVAFERERRGAKFDRILNNVSTLIDMRESGGYRIPKIRIQTVRLPEIDLNNYRSFWQNYCDEVAVVDYKAVEDRNQTIIDGNWACPQLWQRMTIEWDGTIMPCNNDDLRKISPGNAMEMPVKDCWHDQIVEQARKLHRQGKSHLIESCNGCPWRTTQINKRQRTAN